MFIPVILRLDLDRTRDHRDTTRPVKESYAEIDKRRLQAAARHAPGDRDFKRYGSDLHFSESEPQLKIQDMP